MIFYNRGENMKNMKIMSEFLNSLVKNKKLTLFYKIILDYKILNDYNYISRIVKEKNYIIIDIYDNILDNRFNRYIFDFQSNNNSIDIKCDNDVIVTKICVNGKYKPNNNLMRLAYLFSNNNHNIMEYAKTFLPDDILILLENILKNKSIL